MTINQILNTTSELRTANINGVGVNGVSLRSLASLDTPFSYSENTYYYKRLNPMYKLPSILTGFTLFLAAVINVSAVLFKNAFNIINVILEIAPRGIFFLLSLLNLVFSYCSLSSIEWLMKSNITEEDCSHFCSNELPFFPLYVQHDLTLYE